MRLKGRQIRNIISSAQALAEERGGPLGYDDIYKMYGLVMNFNDVLKMQRAKGNQDINHRPDSSSSFIFYILAGTICANAIVSSHSFMISMSVTLHYAEH